MRRALNSLYLASGVLAAFFLVAIALMVLAQVVANVIGKVSEWLTGDALGLIVPSYAQFTGYFLAASSFLALAYTLRAGGHIRVKLLLRNAPPALRRVAEVWCCALGAVIAGYFAWWACALTWESWRFGDLSFGMVPVPLWIPQAAMALGLVILAVSFLDELTQVLRGKTPTFELAGPDLAAASDNASPRHGRP
jgi:TRAP-type C4-dicarboxylate transport system permease small subunit